MVEQVPNAQVTSTDHLKKRVEVSQYLDAQRALKPEERVPYIHYTSMERTILEVLSPLDAYIGLMKIFLHHGWGRIPIFTNSSQNLLRMWVYDVQLIIRQPWPNDLDLSLTGYKMPTRWTKFLREYTDADGILEFWRQFKLSKDAWREPGYQTPLIADHSMGNCLWGWTARWGDESKNLDPIITVQSRSMMITPVGALDISLASLIPTYLKFMGAPKQMYTVMHIKQLQTISWKAMYPFELSGLMPEHPDDLPDTPLGGYLRQHIEETHANKLPKLRMLAANAESWLAYRQGKKKREPSFYAAFPEAYLPMALRRKGG